MENKICVDEFLRGSLRRIWCKYPLKTEFIKQKRKRILIGKKLVWGGTCNICNLDFQAKKMQVDHICEVGTLIDVKDILPFIQNLLMSNDLQYVCIQCHKAKTKKNYEKNST